MQSSIQSGFSDQNEKKPAATSTRNALSQKTILTIILVLLALQVLLSGFTMMRDIVREQQVEEERAALQAEVAQYADNLDQLTTQMLEDYKEEVYNNPNVDSAAKQEIMGTEYNYMAILLLIRQNTRMMEILAEMP